MASYHKYRAQKLTPSEAQEKGVLARNAIISGIPKMIGSRKDFRGFILIPIMAGKVMTLIPVPIVDRYDVYEVKNEASAGTFLIAHARGEQRLPEERIVVAGVIKEIKMERGEGVKKFLEINYFF